MARVDSWKVLKTYNGGLVTEDYFAPLDVSCCDEAPVRPSSASIGDAEEGSRGGKNYSSKRFL